MTGFEIFAVLGTFVAVFVVGYVVAERWHRRRTPLADLAERQRDGIV